MRMEQLLQQIEAEVNKYMPEEISLLEKFCNIDCGTGNTAGNSKVLDLVEARLNAMGAQVEYRDAKPYGRHIIGRINPGNPNGKLILNAHLDTVFAEGDAEKYPFHIEGDDAYGLGSSDCKGGVIISLYSVRVLKNLGLLPDLEIVFLYNCDEEIGSPSGRSLFQEEAENAKYAVCFEPSRDDDGILTYRQGSAAARIEVFGKRAHSALFWQGTSASACLVKTLAKLLEYNDDSTYLNFNIGPMEVPTSISIVAPYACADISVRMNDHHSWEEIESILMSLEKNPPLAGCSVKVTTNVKFPVMERSSGNVSLYRHFHEAGKAMGWELPEQSTTGGGDASHFSSLGIPTICGMGSYTYGAHIYDEKTSLSSLKRRTCLAALGIATLRAETE